MSAAVGKCGALVPTVLFNYIGNATKFWVVCWAGLLGFFMTVMFIPDATGETMCQPGDQIALLVHPLHYFTKAHTVWSSMVGGKV